MLLYFIKQTALLCTGLFRSLSRFQVFLLQDATSSSKIFTLSCCPLIWLLSDVASSERLSRYGSVFSDIAC